MKKLALLILAAISFEVSAQSIDDVLSKAKEYHDPNDEWTSLNTTLYFTEQRPDGPDRSSEITLDNTRSYMKINRNNEEVYEVLVEECKVLNGDKGADRGLMLRNYYLYLWGLPMKLYDEGTPFDRTVYEEKIGDVSYHTIRVVYEADTWYFYFDKQSGRLSQYKFYKDEEASKGELITLEDEIQVGTMKIPQKRSWYTLPDNKFLGTDILSSVK